MQRAFAFVLALGAIIVVSGVVYYGVGWVKHVFGDSALYVVALLLLGIVVLVQERHRRRVTVESVTGGAH